jgi:hypothetical protein
MVTLQARAHAPLHQDGPQRGGHQPIMLHRQQSNQRAGTLDVSFHSARPRPTRPAPPLRRRRLPARPPLHSPHHGAPPGRSTDLAASAAADVPSPVPSTWHSCSQHQTPRPRNASGDPHTWHSTPPSTTLGLADQPGARRQQHWQRACAARLVLPLGTPGPHRPACPGQRRRLRARVWRSARPGQRR